MRRTKAFRLQLSLVPGEAMAAPRSLSRLSSHGSLRAGPGLSPRSAVRIQRISLSGLQHVRTVTWRSAVFSKPADLPQTAWMGPVQSWFFKRIFSPACAKLFHSGSSLSPPVRFIEWASLSFPALANSLECGNPPSSCTCLGFQDLLERTPCAFVSGASPVLGFYWFSV